MNTTNRKTNLSRAMHAAWSAAVGHDVGISAFDNLDYAHTPECRAQIALATGWLEHAHREACVAATADGESTASTEWAAERAVAIALAIHRLECASAKKRILSPHKYSPHF